MTTQLLSDPEVLIVVDESAAVVEVVEEAATTLQVIEEVTEVLEVQVPGIQGPAQIGDSSYPVYVGNDPPLNTKLLWLDTSGA